MDLHGEADAGAQRRPPSGGQRGRGEDLHGSCGQRLEADPRADPLQLRLAVYRAPHDAIDRQAGRQGPLGSFRNSSHTAADNHQ